MRLLTPQEVSVKKSAAEDSARKTVYDLESRMREKRAELADFEAQMKRVMAAQTITLEQNNEKILELNNEISRLEMERREQMVPIDNLKQLLETEIAQFKSKRAECAYRETQAKKTQEEMINKLELLETKNDALNKKEFDLTKKEQGIHAQEIAIASINDQLTKKINDHKKQVKEETKKIQEEKNKIAQERHAITVLYEQLQHDKEKLSIQEKELKARYDTLAITMKQLNK